MQNVSFLQWVVSGASQHGGHNILCSACCCTFLTPYSIQAVRTSTILHLRSCASFTLIFQSWNGGSCTVFLRTSHLGLGQEIKSSRCMLSSPALWGHTIATRTSKTSMWFVLKDCLSKSEGYRMRGVSCLVPCQLYRHVCQIVLRSLGSIQIWSGSAIAVLSKFLNNIPTESSPTASHLKTRQQPRRKLKILSLNCNGLKGSNKQAEFHDLVELHQPDIIGGWESKIDPSIPICSIFWDKFEGFRKDRTTSGGSVFIVIQNDLTIVKEPHFDVED